MTADCHMHMILDGVYYRAAIDHQKEHPDEDLIRARLAALLDVPVSSVSVKGKTNEGMDAIGAGVGIAVHAVALLVPGEA